MLNKITRFYVKVRDKKYRVNIGLIFFVSFILVLTGFLIRFSVSRFFEIGDNNQSAATSFVNEIKPFPNALYSHGDCANDCIKPYSGNPYYWQYKGRPIMLLGAGKDHNLFNFANPGGMISYLEELVLNGGNYVRQVMNELTEFNREENVDPYLKVSGRFDLTQFNTEYWNRFSNSLQQAYNRDIIVSIEVWGTFWYFCNNPPDWCRWNDVNPFNPKNNNNYNAAQSGLPESWDAPAGIKKKGNTAPGHPVLSGHVHPFFKTVPSLKNNQLVLGYQQQWVRKILSYSLNYGNVLYVMGNEVSTDPEWSKYWASFIKDEATKKGKTVYITEMVSDIDITSYQHNMLYECNSLFSFIEMSQNNHQGDDTIWPYTIGDVHWNNMQKRRKQIAKNPRPMNNVKIYGSHAYGVQRAGEERFWRNIIGGTASARFHRQANGMGNSMDGLRNLKGARMLFDKIDIFSCEPDSNFSLFSNRTTNQAYACKTNADYALYVARAGEINLRLSSGEYQLTWFDIRSSRWLDPQAISSRGTAHPVKIIPPGPAYAAVLLKQNTSGH